MNDMQLLENILIFATENSLYIAPSKDIFNQTPFDLSVGNRDAL